MVSLILSDINILEPLFSITNCSKIDICSVLVCPKVIIVDCRDLDLDSRSVDSSYNIWIPIFVEGVSKPSKLTFLLWKFDHFRKKSNHSRHENVDSVIFSGESYSELLRNSATKYTL